MKSILTIDPDNKKGNTGLKRRYASRAVVSDNEGKVALLHVTKDNYYKLPGGGFEKDENMIEALKRECIEEIGCQIEAITELASVDEYRSKFNLHQTSYCFVARVSGKKGTPDFTESEIEDGFEIVWVDKEKARELLSKSNPASYEGSFIKARDTALVEEYFKTKE